jgi:hypothetical protein
MRKRRAGHVACMEEIRSKHTNMLDEKRLWHRSIILKTDLNWVEKRTVYSKE